MSKITLEDSMSATVQELIQFIQAAHVSQKTDWGFEGRGGIVLQSPPEALKTTTVNLALEPYENAEVFSDINARKLGQMHERILAGKRASLGFLDYQKIWERDSDTATHVEGIIRALIEEGWRGLSDQAEYGMAARAMVVLCITNSFFLRSIAKWEENGFARRLIFLKYTFGDSESLVEAIRNDSPFQLSADAQVRWPSNRIKMNVTDEEFEELRRGIKHQFGCTLPLQFSKRILNTLKWHYRDRVEDQEKADACAHRVFASVASLMTKDGGIVTLKRPNLALVPGTGEPSKGQRKRA